MSQHHADLVDYYEREARLGLRREPRSNRVALRQQFIELVLEEARSTVIDIGAGPGHDARAFGDAGLVSLGVDLAHSNGVRAAQCGITVLQGSTTALPLRARSFGAGWSMSTFMHLEADDTAVAISEVTNVLVPGAPLWIGLWGHQHGPTVVDDTEIAGHRRTFHLRPMEQNLDLFATHANVEAREVWRTANNEWDYQVFRIRVRA